MKLMNGAGRMIEVPERPLEPPDARMDYRDSEQEEDEEDE